MVSHQATIYGKTVIHFNVVIFSVQFNQSQWVFHYVVVFCWVQTMETFALLITSRTYLCHQLWVCKGMYPCLPALALGGESVARAVTLCFRTRLHNGNYWSELYLPVAITLLLILAEYI